MAKPTSNPGKGNGPKTDVTLTLVMVTDQNGDGLPNHGDQIRFDVVSSEEWHQVSVKCMQNGVDVFGALQLPNQTTPITLSSAHWPSGAAQGTAYLEQANANKPLATLEFAVGA